MNLTRTLLASALVALLAACSNGAQDGQKPADEAPQSSATAQAADQSQAAGDQTAANAASASAYEQPANSSTAAPEAANNGG